MERKHGARVRLMDENTVLVHQEIKSGPDPQDRFVIERHENGKNKERFVRYHDDAQLLQAVRDALNGQF